MSYLSMKIADEYREVLRGKLNKLQFDSVLTSGIHPEEYLDANMALEEAFIKVMSRESDVSSDIDIYLLNSALDIFHNEFCFINSNII